MARTDKKTMELIDAVKKQKAEIAKLTNPSYKTNCSFSYDGNQNNTTNIRVETDVRKLISIVAFVAIKEKDYENAVKLLALESSPAFGWQGFSANDWIEDIKLRINKVQISMKKKKLEALEDRLRKIISPELMADLELEAIEAELK